MELRPANGGFLRPFGTAWFVTEFLKGSAPEDSRQIDPDVGAPMTDMHFEYKSALHRAHVRDAVEKEEERRIRRGLPAYSEEDYTDRLAHYLDRIPYRSVGMKYAGFTRHFGHLKRLNWVELTGRTEPSTIQEYYPDAPPRVYYRLTRKGGTLLPQRYPTR